jgi:type IV secretion system protein TrbE
MQSSIAVALKESCPTKIFLPNASAKDEMSSDFYRGMGLNHRQIDIIANATPKSEYYLSSPMGNRLFDLALGSKALTLCSSSSVNDQKLIDEIKKQQSSHTFLENFLRIRGL